MAHSLNLLGIPEIRTPTGELVDFPIGKPMALLSYLALEGGEVRRDDLGLLLWPGSAPDRARHSVRQAIWLIRRKLGEDVILGDDPVRLSGGALTCDVQAFRGALKRGELDEAQALWRGPLLSHLSLSDCREWEHWREEQRELVRRGFFEALVDQSRILVEVGKGGEALPYLSEAIGLSPYSLEVRLLQVETLLELRQVPAARQALEEARREVGDGGGAEAEMARLDERLRVIQSRMEGGIPERLGESVEFVGRAGELSDLRGLWKRAKGGRSGVACVRGPTGIGKTRLVGEFISGLEEGGGLVARARGYRGEHRIPWGTVADLVRQLIELPGARGISLGSEQVLRSVLLPSLGGTGNGNGHENGHGNGEIHPAALSDAVLDLVEAVAFEEPLAVFVDDWQWVDKESRALLGKVMRGARGLSCLFLLAERTGERRLGQEGAESVTGELGGRRILLSPLREGELGELLALLAEFTDTEGADELVGRIHRVTGGNPLFVGEILRKLADDGVYRWEGGRWVLAVEGMPAELDLPESVQELIRERLGRLSPTAAQVASALAAERRSVPVAVLRRRAGVDEAVFTRAIGELLDREVVEWVGAKELDFTHDQLRDAAGAGVFDPPPRWERLRGWARKRPRVAVAAVLGTAAILVLAVMGTLQLVPQSIGAGEPGPPTYPYGKGRVLILGDSVMELIPPEREGGEWQLLPSDIWKPSGPLNRVHGPFRTPSGSLRWFGENYIGLEAPFVLELFEWGGQELLYKGPGDDDFGDLAPDGATAVLLSEDISSPSYRRDLIRLSPTDPGPTILYSAAEMIGTSAWSPDGQKIMTVLTGAIDTVMVLDPSGGEIGRWTFPSFHYLGYPSWCGDSRHGVLIGAGSNPGVGILLDTSTGVERRFGEEFLSVGSPICLGSIRAALFLGITEDSRWIVLQDLSSDSTTRLFELPGSSDAWVRWVPDEVQPPVWGLEILGGDRNLGWAEREALSVLGLSSDGSRVEVDVAWRTSDPGVVSVTSSGVITANGIGETYVTGEFSGWVRDSIRVSVLDVLETPEAVMFRETFSRDLSDWNVPDSTFPSPEIVRLEGGQVLSLNGDGVYRDFINSQKSYSLQYGGTLELEFRLPLSRNDRQNVRVCLTESRVGGGEGLEAEAPTGGALCVMWPTGILSDFREGFLTILGPQRGVIHQVDVSSHLPSDDWVHLAMQVRPDGIGRFFLNRELIFETPYVVRGHDSSHWKIDIGGAAVDTELLFRDITLWRGERY